MAKLTDVKGKCIGIRFRPRGPEDDHILISLMTEDDTTWVQGGILVSSYWLNDLIKTAQKAKRYLQKNAKRDGRYGFKAKRKGDLTDYYESDNIEPVNL